MNLILKKIYIENFKGIKQLAIDFQEKTIISGQNATGKTTIMDSFTWLLFNKDSEGKSDFDIRPNDREGNPIDNVVIKVSAILKADGKETLLTKTQEQNWVKKRGSEVSQLQGNINKYEINEIPKGEKAFCSWAIKKGLMVTDERNKRTAKNKKINGASVRCYWIKLPPERDKDGFEDIEEEQMGLPFD